MPTEKELLERIRQLEELNSTLQDKLDMIYSIVAPDFDDVEPADVEPGEDDDSSGLVQITKAN